MWEQLPVAVQLLALVAGGTGAWMALGWMFFAGIHRIPIGVYRFELEGRGFEVRNYVGREEILVDGVPVPRTRVAGDGGHAMHAVGLPDGRQVNIVIDAVGGSRIRCRALVDDEVVYDSAPDPAKRAVRAKVQLSPVASPDAEAAPAEDPRWAAAKVLFAELAAEGDVAAAAGSLEVELSGAMRRLAQARRAAEAHATLGGADEEGAALVSSREAVVADLLGLLRALHLAASGREVPAAAVSEVEDTLQRLDADREVDSARLRQVAAARTQAMRTT
jgi:hypothetical protein